MGRFPLACLLAVVFSSAGILGEQTDRPVDVTGKWVMALEMSMGTSEPFLDLKQDGAKVTGTYTGRYGAFALTGTIKARRLAFTFTMGSADDPVEMTFTAEVSPDGQSMKGEADLSQMGDAVWTAKRQKEK